MEYNYSINLPYPELSGKISPNTMALLMESFGGKNSEFTSLTTYIYQHLMVGNKNSNLATLLSKISIVEMKHQELIGEAIVFFGRQGCGRTRGAPLVRCHGQDLERPAGAGCRIPCQPCMA